MGLQARTAIVAGLAAVAAMTTTTAATAAVAVRSAGGWSAPVTLDADHGENVAIATDAAGDAVAASWASGNSPAAVEVNTKTGDGPWSAPTALTPATYLPVAAMSEAGRAVVAWPGADASILVSSRAVDGTWSTPRATGLTGMQPSIGMDRAGNAVIVTISRNAMLAARVRADGAVEPPQTLATDATFRGGVAVSPNGHVAFGWIGTDKTIHLALGDSTGGAWSTSTVGSIGRRGAVALAVNDAGRALAVQTGLGVLVSEHGPTGDWSPWSTVGDSAYVGARVPVLTAGGDEVVVYAQDTAGTAGPIQTYAVRKPAGGTWGPPARISTGTDDHVTAVDTVATPAGAVVALWSDWTTQAEYAAVAPPGADFGTPVRLGPSYGTDALLAAAPGHVLAGWAGPGRTPTVAGLTLP